MYIAISFFGFSDSRNSSWAQISAAMPSSTGPVRKMIRSFSRREKMSKARSPRLVCSTTIGTRPSAVVTGSRMGGSPSWVVGGACATPRSTPISRAAAARRKARGRRHMRPVTGSCAGLGQSARLVSESS